MGVAPNSHSVSPNVYVLILVKEKGVDEPSFFAEEMAIQSLYFDMLTN
jgi:hypothetical protein